MFLSLNFWIYYMTGFILAIIFLIMFAFKLTEKSEYILKTIKSGKDPTDDKRIEAYKFIIIVGIFSYISIFILFILTIFIDTIVEIIDDTIQNNPEHFKDN